MVIQVLECNIHAGRKAIVKDVISNTLGLRLVHEESYVVNAAGKHCIMNGHNDISHDLIMIVSL